MTELKPCPFCRADKSRLEGMSNRYVRCGNGNCDAMGPNAKSDEEAVRRWDAAPRQSTPVPAAVHATRTLHDEYTMVALLGWMSNPESAQVSVQAIVTDARAAADEAMKAREVSAP